MSRTPNMRTAASKFEHAHFTANHAAYREHLSNLQALLCDVSLLVLEDAQRSGTWLRGRSPSSGLMDWLHTFFMSLRLKAYGKNASEAVLEAAKDVVRGAAVHQEYMALETSKSGTASSTVGGKGRYRTEGS